MATANTDELIGLKQAYQQEVAVCFRAFHQARQSHERVDPESAGEADRQFRDRIKALRKDYALAIQLLGTL